MNPNKSKYNIRGWLTDINDTGQLQQTGQPVDLFAFRINYSDPVAGYFQSSGADVQPLFNGNIAETYWRTASDNTLRGYGYTYDELNRLENAYYQKPNSITPLPLTFDEYLAYDLNGNITGLQRYSGDDTPGSAQLTDELDYSYFTNSNRLREVTDNQNSSIGFDDGNTTGDDYAYDANGSMTMDKNKGITSISYNHLNLPVEIIWSGTKKIEYLYNAAGVKVRKKVTDGTAIQTTDYLDGFQYSQELLEFFSHGEGYVKATAQSESPVDPQYAFNYVFNYTDHLGNIRVSYTKDPQTGNLKILDESHYYPFGLKHQEYVNFGFVNNPIQGVIIAPIINNPYQYKYNGKEWQDELGLGMYDMDMRQYDPAIARWVVMDPVIHHSVSPYSAFDNNPVFWADPSGVAPELGSVFEQSGMKVASLTVQGTGTSIGAGGAQKESSEKKAQDVITHTFKYDSNAQTVGTDEVTQSTTSTEQTTDAKGNNITRIIWEMTKAQIDSNGNVGNVSKTVSVSTTGQKTITASDVIKLEQSSSEFQTIVKGISEFKIENHQSPIQAIAKQNANENKTANITSGLMVTIGKGLNYIPGVSKLVGYGLQGIGYGTKVFFNDIINKTNPEKISIHTVKNK